MDSLMGNSGRIMEKLSAFEHLAAVMLLVLFGMTGAEDVNRTNLLPAGVWIAGGHYQMNADSQHALLMGAMRSCLRTLIAHQMSGSNSNNETFCPPAWDNITCWPSAQPDQVLVRPCPNYVHNFKVHGVVRRQCLSDGSWFINPETSQEWSNYSECESTRPAVPGTSDLIREHVPIITKLYNIGYGISLLSLFLAVFIMLYFKKLYCPRNTLHINLFISFMIRALMSFVRENLFIDGQGLRRDIEIHPNTSDVTFIDVKGINVSHWECKTVTFIFMYSLAANYIWIFTEGLYLHTLIIVSVFTERNTIRGYIVFGWLTPFTFLIPWAIVRAKLHNIYCWNITHKPEYEWIIKGPLLMFILINFGIFINVLRVLFTKLTAPNNREGRRYRYIKLAKSTLVLIPLFGVHYILFSLVPSEYVSDTMEVVKLYFEMICNSFQGFLVALLYCFLNGEVQAEIKKKWHRFQLHRSHKRPRRQWSSSKTANGLSVVDSTCPTSTYQPAYQPDTSPTGNGAQNGNKRSGHNRKSAGDRKDESGRLLVLPCRLEGNDDCYVSESGFTEIMSMSETK